VEKSWIHSPLLKLSMIPLALLIAYQFFVRDIKATPEGVSIEDSVASADQLIRKNEDGSISVIRTGPITDSSGSDYLIRKNPDGTQSIIRTGPIVAPQEETSSSEPYQNMRGNQIIKRKEYELLMQEGKEAYKNHAYGAADRIFQYLSRELTPGKIEPNIWDIKAFYQKLKHEDGTQKAQEGALANVNYYLKQKPGNPVLEALKKRLEKGTNIETFSVEAYKLHQQGYQAYRNKNYPKAHQLLSKAVQLDPYNATAWLDLGSAAYRIKEGDDNKKQEATKQVYEEAIKYNPSDTNLINALTFLKNRN